MLAKAGSEHARQDTDFNRHKAMLSGFLDAVRTDRGRDKSFSLLLRSADSIPAQVLLALADELAAASIRPRLILAGLEPEEGFQRLVQVLRRLNGADFESSVRWAKNPALLDAHEQTILGSGDCWVGDALRRDPSRRNALSIFSHGHPDKVRLAELSFTALWHAAIPVPERRLFGALSPNASAHYDNATIEEPLEPPLVPQSLQPWPLIRH